MSFPPGTWMFQFPGFAPRTYRFGAERRNNAPGCPIRRSPDQRLLSPPRSFSQSATSFIASRCQGIHQMPFSRLRASIHAHGDLATPVAWIGFAHRSPRTRLAPLGRKAASQRPRCASVLKFRGFLTESLNLEDSSSPDRTIFIAPPEAS